MSETNDTLLDAVALNQNTESKNLHRIESEEVAISREAISSMSKAARSLLARVLGAGSVETLSLGEIVSLFASRLYWNEVGGELIMCAQIGGHAVCLPIPAEHWNVIVAGRFQ